MSLFIDVHDLPGPGLPMEGGPPRPTPSSRERQPEFGVHYLRYWVPMSGTARLFCRVHAPDAVAAHPQCTAWRTA